MHNQCSTALLGTTGYVCYVTEGGKPFTSHGTNGYFSAPNLTLHCTVTELYYVRRAMCVNLEKEEIDVRLDEPIHKKRKGNRNKREEEKEQ